jgi:flagellar motor switch protein FliN/FliY
MSEDTVTPENAEDWDDVLEDSGTGDTADAEDPWAAALEEQAEAEAQAAPVEQLNDSSKPKAGSDMNLDMVLELPVTISMEIGRTKISIRNLLQLSQGSVIELDRLAGEAMDVLVNDTLIAHGEVVVVNDKFGIRLTDVISADERIRKLR